MDFLEFANVSFRPNADTGYLCEELNNILRESIWYDTFKIQNTKWLWLVNDVAAINSNKVLCGSFGLYPSFVAGILNSVKGINFYVLCNKKLKYADYIEKCISGKKWTIPFKSHTGEYFQLSSSGETIVITFETIIIHGKLLSEITFAYAVLNKIRLSSLAYGIVSVHKRVNYITKC